MRDSEYRGAPLEDGARVAVVGAGPAGTLFAISLLRQANQLGRRVRVSLFEGKPALPSHCGTTFAGSREGCNHCAGGISPQTCDALAAMGLEIPDAVIQSRVRSLTVQGHWKNIEFRVPAERRMLSVYRGSRPRQRSDRSAGFDAWLLEQALLAGAELVGAEVQAVSYSATGAPQLTTLVDGSLAEPVSVDFLAVAGGVNQAAGEQSPLMRSLRRLLPGFSPPSVRRCLVFELQAPAAHLRSMQGEVHFVEHGSAELEVEMCSVIPKQDFVTVVLVGRSIDLAEGPGAAYRVLGQFASLPHVRKLLPGPLQCVCSCRPNMVTGTALCGVGERVAVIGDLATARLYKDGIYSACLTSEALACTVLLDGTSRECLRQRYWPSVKAIQRDNRFGRVVFAMHRLVFATPVLSRIVYQAIFTERRTRTHFERRLGRVFWSIASGDAPYREICGSLLHPEALRALLAGGLLVTLRNTLAELMLGLDWRGLGRHTTGVYKEKLIRKRNEFQVLASEAGCELPARPEFERMYTIQIRATPDRVFGELGRFGDDKRGFFRIRMVRVRRIQGEANREGSVIRYELPLRRLTFNLKLERALSPRYLVYTVEDGFAAGGVMVFEIEEQAAERCSLSVYLGFDFPSGEDALSRVGWSAFKRLFPGFIHDVVWNHSLCQLKDLAESRHPEEQPLLRPATSLASCRDREKSLVGVP